MTDLLNEGAAKVVLFLFLQNGEKRRLATDGTRSRNGAESVHYATHKTHLPVLPFALLPLTHKTHQHAVCSTSAPESE